MIHGSMRLTPGAPRSAIGLPFGLLAFVLLCWYMIQTTPPGPDTVASPLPPPPSYQGAPRSPPAPPPPWGRLGGRHRWWLA